MIKFGNIKKEHLVGAAVGVGTVAVGYYLYKKNQSKVVDLNVVLYNRGELNTPKRIRIVVVLSNFLENF